MNRFVFAGALPLVLFRAVSRVGGGQGSVDVRLLIGFFGSCFLVFALGYWTGKRVLRTTASGPAMMGIASVFSNNGLLGVPLVSVLLGPDAMPAVAWIMTFNAVTLWTLVTVVIEGSKREPADFRGLRRTVLKIAASPIVLGIGAGALVAGFGLTVPHPVAHWLDMASRTAGPLALLALGLDVANYEIKRELRAALWICGFKLVVQPVCAWVLCLVMELPTLETQVVVLLASLSVGVNVHMMAQHFGALQTAVASSLVLSTFLGALTTPLVLALVVHA